MGSVEVGLTKALPHQHQRPFVWGANDVYVDNYQVSIVLELEGCELSSALQEIVIGGNLGGEGSIYQDKGVRTQFLQVSHWDVKVPEGCAFLELGPFRWVEGVHFP
jgi:hypothetical protein